MRILVIGKKGQLGRSINKIVSTYAKDVDNQNHNEFIFVGREELDLSNEGSINSYFDRNMFDIIINCAAYTNVDAAEDEPDVANQINHLAVKYLATIANNQQATLIHISTDYVFDGESSKPYLETDDPNPINVYGRTKLAGEQALQTVNSMNAHIIRTSWVYSEYGSNFVRTMLKLGKERSELSVVTDQIGSPTYAADLAQFILSIVKSKFSNNKTQATEIFHYSNDAAISWYDFTKQIFKFENIDCKVIGIPSEKFPTRAKRPKNSCLYNSKFIKTVENADSLWKESLSRCLKQIKDGSKSVE